MSQVDNDVDDFLFETNRKLSKAETECGFVTTIDTAALIALTTTVYGVVTIVIQALQINSMKAMMVCLIAYLVGAVIEFMYVAASLRKNNKAYRTRVYILKEILHVLDKAKKDNMEINS